MMESLTERQRSHKTHCPRGHEYTPENTKVSTTSQGWLVRRCLICERERIRKRDARLAGRPIARSVQHHMKNLIDSYHDLLSSEASERELKEVASATRQARQFLDETLGEIDQRLRA